jgi:hypothetical protein
MVWVTYSDLFLEDFGFVEGVAVVAIDCLVLQCCWALVCLHFCA